MNGTLARLVRLAGVGKGRVALSVVIGALTVVFGVGLMATAGYLISRAAEHPPVLALSEDEAAELLHPALGAVSIAALETLDGGHSNSNIRVRLKDAPG